MIQSILIQYALSLNPTKLVGYSSKSIWKSSTFIYQDPLIYSNTSKLAGSTKQDPCHDRKLTLVQKVKLKLFPDSQGIFENGFQCRTLCKASEWLQD